MLLPRRLQGQKVKSQGGAGAYCGGHLAAQLVTSVPNVTEFQAVIDSCRMNEGTLLENSRKIMKSRATDFSRKI